jgi:transcription elongation factor Elf1
MSEDLGPCPKCGKRQGVIHESSAGRFRYFVLCGNCAWGPPSARTRGIAVKMWNEAKPAYNKKARARRA